jgi:hypothetical protein
MIQGLSYEAYSDTLIVASFGRGITKPPIFSFNRCHATPLQVSSRCLRRSERLQSRSQASFLNHAASNPLPILHHLPFGYRAKRNALIDVT